MIVRTCIAAIVFIALWNGGLYSQELHIPKNRSAEEMAHLYMEAAGEDNSGELYLLAIEQYGIALKNASCAADSIKILVESSFARCHVQDTHGMTVSLQKALDITARNYGEESLMFTSVLLDAAKACNAAGDYRLSYSLLRLCRKSNPDFHGNAALKWIYLQTLAENDFHSGKNLKAVRLSRKVCRQTGRHYGYEGEEYVNSLLSVSGYASLAGKPVLAAKYHGKAKEYSSIVLGHFGELSEAGRARFWKKSSGYYEKTIQIAKASGSLKKEAYDAVLFSKGILLNTSAAFSEFVRRSNDPEVTADYDRMCMMMAKGYPDNVIDSLDQKIVQRLSDLGLSFTDKNATVSWQDVRKALGDDDLAIEFFGSSAEGFGAVLLRKDWIRPKIVTLRDYAGKRKNPVFWKDSLGKARYKETTSVSRDTEWKISRTIWNRRIRRHFPSTPQGRVFFSPSGELNLAGIEYLPAGHYSDTGNRFTQTLADCYKMYRLSSTRQLVRNDTNHPEDSMSAGIFGGADYGAQFNRLTAGIKRMREGKSRLIDTDYENRLAAGYRTDAGKLQPLPGSILEVHAVDNIIDGTSVSTNLLTGAFATEDAFKLLSKKENIIHIATHGFYIRPSNIFRHPYFQRNATANPQFISDPLNRSGVHFAGSQKVWSGYRSNPGLEDGVLTSKEISLMDLRNTDLIVLSACNTAMGDVSKDGIYGLQRAFKKAGANTMILSLWQINDDATRYMMQCFYQNRFILGMSIHEAFMSAIRLLRQKPEYSSPYYWASFILLDSYATDNSL